MKTRSKIKIYQVSLVLILLLFILPEAPSADEMHNAAMIGDLAKLKRLVESGWNINSRDDEGWTPLIVAGYYGHPEAVRFLIENGAAVNARSYVHRFTPLIIASLNGHTDIVELLVAAEADLDVTEGKLGETALMLATEKGHTDIVRNLLDAGADPNVKDLRGFTALIKASSEGYGEIVEMLLQAGAGVNDCEENGATSLTLASQQGHCGIVKLLIFAGAAVDPCTTTGFTPLMIASYCGKKDIVDILLKNGADPYRRTPTGGFTALMLAALKGHGGVVTLLEQQRLQDNHMYAPQEAEKIPEGITYVRAEKEVNREAREYLLDLFARPDSGIRLPKAIVCGPFLWYELIFVAGFDENIGIPVLFNMPLGNTVHSFQGRAIRWEDKTTALQDYFRNLFDNLGGFSLRKLSEQEISLYWSMVPYDIHEPVFMIESPGFILVADICSEGLFFLENFYRLLQL